MAGPSIRFPRRPRRPRWSGPVGAAAVCCALVWGMLAGSSGRAADPAPGADGRGPVRVVESEPELFYMEGEGGRLVPVPGFRYRDFVELFRLREGLPGVARPPAAVLEKLVLVVDLGAAVESRVAEIRAECTVRQSEPGWVAVPLALDGLLLAAPPRHEGPGRMLVDPAPGGRGYRGWFAGGAAADTDVRHVVTLEGRVAVEGNADQETFLLDVPAATTTTLEIRSPRRDPEVSIDPPPIDRRIAIAAGGAGSTVTVAGVVGRTRVRIAARGRAPVDAAAVPRAEVDASVRIDGRVAVTDARILLENLPASLNDVRITLPPGAVLREVRPPAVLRNQPGAETRQVIEVGVERTAAGSAAVELRCERPVDATRGQTFNAVGFAVAGVESWRQRGRISLAVEGDWQAEWTGSLRQVDPPAAARPAGFVAAFAYDDVSAAEFDVRVKQRRSRVVIEPEYRYEVGAERIGFFATLQVATSGAPVAGIEVALDPSWVIEDVGPAAVVDANWTAESGRLVIPFVQGLSGKARVEIRGGRQIDRAAERLDWQLPAPGPQRTVTVGPAAVFIDAASDIELLPDGDEIRGLVRQTAAAVLRAEGERAPLAYRIDADKARFVAQRRFLPRRVDADLENTIDVDDRVVRVLETIRLEVFHVPLEFIELVVPEQVKAIEVRQERALLDAVEIGADAAAEGPRRFRALLTRRLLGAGEVQVSYELPLEPVAAGAGGTVDVPLVQPADARIGRQTAVVRSVPELVADVLAAGWKREPDGGAGQPRRAWAAARSQSAVPVAITRRRSASGGDVTVEAAWLRTGVFPDRREDVYTYALAGSGGAVPVTLPTPLRGAEGAGQLTVSLDGLPLPTTPDTENRLTIDLPPRAGAERSRWLLEIRAIVPWQRGGVARWTAMPTNVLLDPPSFPDGVKQARFYWEVDSPPDEYLIGAPRHWTVQQRWEWGRLGPDRVPVVERKDLAAWVRAAGTDSAVADPPARFAAVDVDLPRRERRAVFSGVGRPGAAQPWLVPAWFIVAVWSGATLALGLAFVYRPAVRRAPIVLAVGACAALATASFPDVAPLWALGAAPGLLLAAVAWGLRAVVEERPRPTVIPVSTGVVSASSMTRLATSTPSLVVSPTVAGGGAIDAGRGER